MADRSVKFTGLEFENPFLLSSAPPTESESNIMRAFEAGWGGVVTKTIGLHPVTNVVGAKAKFLRTSPDDASVSMKKRPGAALHSSWNWELISDKALDWWVPRIQRIKAAYPKRMLIASIMAGSGAWDAFDSAPSAQRGEGARAGCIALICYIFNSYPRFIYADMRRIWLENRPRRPKNQLPRVTGISTGLAPTACLASSSLARELRCTSSGPSASRRVRWWA